MAYCTLLAAITLLAYAAAMPADNTETQAAKGRDCGTWTMYCGGVPVGDNKRGQSAEGACNNACYYINFQHKGDFVGVVDEEDNNNHNRHHSGCEVGGSLGASICNRMPISQRFHDPFEHEADPKKQKYNCDEFPMAAMKQGDFNKGQIRNSLRCIDKKENSAGGQQFKSFVEGTGGGLRGRTCQGKLKGGDSFKVAFDYEGADRDKLQYCQWPGHDPKKSADTFQFYMTDMQGANGMMHNPYNPNTDNHYADAITGKDVLQCKVQLTRNRPNQYHGIVYDSNGKAQGDATKDLNNNGDKLVVPGKGGLLDLGITRTADMGEINTKGSKVQFNYGNDPAIVVVIGILTGDSDDFAWSSETSGTSPDYAKRDKDVVQPGGYCQVPKIQGSTSGDSQTMECYFPCSH